MHRTGTNFSVAPGEPSIWFQGFAASTQGNQSKEACCSVIAIVRGIGTVHHARAGHLLLNPIVCMYEIVCVMKDVSTRGFTWRVAPANMDQGQGLLVTR